MDFEQALALAIKSQISSQVIEYLFSADDNQLETLLNAARNVSTPDVIYFFYTSSLFPTISLTATYCELNCKHCGRNLLKKLVPTFSPEELVNICQRFNRNGATGVLLSGGCNFDGVVCFEEFYDAIKTIKKTTDLILVAHPGVIDYQQAKLLKEAGIDGVFVDVVGDEDTVQEIYGKESKLDDYRNMLKGLTKAEIEIISPHVCVGLYYGQVKGELKALEIISEFKPAVVVITALMPIKGTPLENCKVKPIEVGKIIAIAKLMMPNVPIALGCARSKGIDRSKIDELAIKAGVNQIAIPTTVAFKIAQRSGIKTRSLNSCCAVPANYLLNLNNPNVFTDQTRMLGEI
ncbi:MAG: radical SAM protein [Euryarchaeota archaeon]|nr:radical SAM protein [Euryarchaeota archaeon]